MDPTSLQAHGQQKLRQQATAAPRRYDGQNGNPLYDPGNGGHYGAFVLPALHYHRCATTVPARLLSGSCEIAELTCFQVLPQQYV